VRDGVGSAMSERARGEADGAEAVGVVPGNDPGGDAVNADELPVPEQSERG